MRIQFEPLMKNVTSELTPDLAKRDPALFASLLRLFDEYDIVHYMDTDNLVTGNYEIKPIIQPNI